MENLPEIHEFNTKGEYDLKSLLFQLPGKSVKINDTWTGRWEYIYEGPSLKQKNVFTTTYTLIGEEPRKGFDCLKIKTLTKEKMTGTQNFGENEVTLSGEMDLEGEIYFAFKEGILVEKTYVEDAGKLNMEFTSPQAMTITYTNYARAKFSLLTDTTKERPILEAFLKKDGVWEGEFQNFVNRNGGIIQEGIILVDIKTGQDQIIRMRNNFIDKNGKESGYTGYTSMKLNGDRLEYIGDSTSDQNTGNRIENHVFMGYCLDRHIYIFEGYTEIHPDGREEKRRNSLHYILLDSGKIAQIADVYVNENLLVFAHTFLVRINGGQKNWLSGKR